jgi:hypothetical protein
MHLGQRGWLKELLTEAVQQHRPESVLKALTGADTLTSGNARARRYLRGILRESGLLFGTPSAELPVQRESKGPEEQLFLAVLKTFARIALDIATILEAAPGPRGEQLLLLFAALGHRLDAAEDIHRRIERIAKQWPLPEKIWQAVESELEERATSLAADPYYGLVLHNGAVYSDANLLGRLAIAYFSTHSFPREMAQRRLDFAAVQKSRLVEVLVALVCAERPPGFPTRRAILRQIEDLRLPAPLGDSARDFALKAFEKPPSLKTLAKDVHSRDMKRFILEQTILASLVDGRRSPHEVKWTHSLGVQLGFEAAEIRHIELAMAEFYKQHRQVVDVFTLATGAETMGEEFVDSMSSAMKKNYRALLKEIRETKELSTLLGRAARGHKLSTEEKRQIRAQLVDVAKAVPALAIFAAPGGALLLVALAKVLPPSMLPSAFREELPEAEPGASERTEASSSSKKKG